MTPTARKLVELFAREVARQMLAEEARQVAEKRTPEPLLTTRAPNDHDASGGRRVDAS